MIDFNLTSIICEPVFAVLTTSLGWFSGRRTNISLWTARKYIGDAQGLLINTIAAESALTPSSIPIFDEVYDGVLPNRATDTAIPLWIESLGQFNIENKCSIWLIFENKRINIANISNGKVKPIIDCLYPIIGGFPGAPKDHIIEMLTVEKVSSNTERSSVRITIWES